MKVVWPSVWVVVMGAAGVLAKRVESPQVDRRAQAPAEPRMTPSYSYSPDTLPEKIPDAFFTTRPPLRTTPTPTATPERTESTTSHPAVSDFGRPVDCADYLMAGYTTSGVYEIFPFTCTCGTSVKVWCDMESDGGGWTVFLNRQQQANQLDFNRTWDEYKQGFGTAGQEYWLGNELLHLMTSSREYAIRLDVRSTSGGYDYVTSDKFSVNSEDNRYLSRVSGNFGGGTSTTNCFRYISNRYFTTFDRDYDSYSGNCAAKQGGGWWYFNCRDFNPTSPYNSSINLVCYYSSQRVTSLQIKIRPTICDSSFKTIHLKDNTCGCEGLAA